MKRRVLFPYREQPSTIRFRTPADVPPSSPLPGRHADSAIPAKPSPKPSPGLLGKLPVTVGTGERLIPEASLRGHRMPTTGIGINRLVGTVGDILHWSNRRRRRRHQACNQPLHETAAAP